MLNGSGYVSYMQLECDSDEEVDVFVIPQDKNSVFSDRIFRFSVRKSILIEQHYLYFLDKIIAWQGR